MENETPRPRIPGLDHPRCDLRGEPGCAPVPALGVAVRRAARTDRNHAEVVDALRKIGASVTSLAAVGNGVPDLLVGFRGRTLLLEVKDGTKIPSKQALTGAQVQFHASWYGGPVYTVRSVDDALRAVQRGMTEDERRALAGQMAMTWRADFGLQRQPGDPLLWGGMTPEEQEELIQRMLQLIEHHWPK